MAGDFKIVASLDIPKSASKINADIPVLEKKLNSIRVLAELDTTRSINSIQSQLNTIAKQAKAPTIKVGIDTSDLKNAINNAKSQISNNNTNTKVQIFDSKQLDAEGRKYFTKATNIIDQVKKYYTRNGALSVDISSIEKSNGQIKSFTASVEESTGIIKKFNFERGKIDTGGAKPNYGFVQTDSLKSIDRNAGSNLKSTLNFLTRIDEKIMSIQSKSTKQANPLKEGTVYYDNYNKKLSETVAKIEEIKSANKTLSIEQKNEIDKMVTELQLYAKEQQKLAYPPMISSTSVEDSVKKAQATLTTLEQKWKNQGILTGEFKTQVANLRAELDKVGNTEGLNKYNTSLKVVQENAKQLFSTQKEISTAITQLNSLQNSPTFTKNASNSQVTQTKQEITSLITAYQNLMTKLQGNITPAGLETVRTELTQLNARFNTATATAKQFESELKNDNGVEKLAQRVALLKAQLEALAKANPKALTRFGNEINSLMATLNNNPDGRAVEQVAKSVQLLRREINNADLAGKTFFQNLKEKASKFTGWMSMTYAISLVTRTIRSMITEVVNLDTALIDLKKTFKGTNSDLQDFYYEANNVAKQLGVTTEEVINSASSWSRLGYNTKEASIAMSKYASMFKMISPDMSMEDSTDGLLSVMKAFDIEVNDVLDGIMSKINKVGNEFGTSNNEIVQMLMRSSSAMKEGNNTLAETIALETSAVEITRDYASVGTAYKTLAMRLRGYDEELETYSNDVQVLSGEIANLTKTAKKPSGVSLFKDEAKTEYKSTLEILRDIREVYDDLDDKTQAQLLEKIAGKRQGQIVAATLSNWDTVEEALVAMENADGSALNEMNTIMESISYRANIFKETLVGIAQGLFSQDFMKSMVDSGTRVLNVFDDLTPIISFLLKQISSLLELITKLADTIGGIPLLIAGIGLKNVGSPKMFGLVLICQQ